MEILIALGIVAFLLAFVLLQSITLVGPAEVGLVNKRFSFRKLRDDNPIAFRGEAGYQSELLMPGLRFKLWPLFAVKKYPWVQIPAGEIGVVISQVGDPLPAGEQVGDLPTRVRAASPTCRRSCRTAGRRAFSVRCCRRARCSRSTPSRSWSSRPTRCTACPIAPELAARRAA